MKGLSLLFLYILLMVNANYLPEHNSSKTSGDDLTEDDVTSSQENLSTREVNPSLSGSESPHIPSTYPRDLNNNLQGIDFSKLERPSSYTRVYVGRDSSGADIYASSPNVHASKSLAENLRIVSGRLEIVPKRNTSQTNGRYIANQFPKPSTKRKLMSDDRGSERIKLSSASSASDVRALLNQEHSEHNQRSTTEQHSGNTVSDGGSRGSNSQCIIEPAVTGNLTIGKAPDLRSDQCTLSDAPASANKLANSPKSPSTQRISSIKSSKFSIEESYTRLRTLNNDGAQSSSDDSLTNFAAAANALQALVEDLDEYFGSARRLWSNLQDRPQESILLVGEISSFLNLMTTLSHPEAIERFGAQSRSLLNAVSSSAVPFNSMFGRQVINFNNNTNEEKRRVFIFQLLKVLREFRNAVGVVVESAQPVMEYIQAMQN